MELVSKVSVDLIQSNATDDMVAMAAWVSHDADSEERLKNREQVRKLINFLYLNKHMSPFEHGQFTFKVDVPLFVAREFHRHRTFSYNEVSGRYTEMKPRFWIGDEARIQKGKPGDYYFESGDEEQTELYTASKKKAVKKAWRHYKKRLASGMAKEQAREDLPLSLMTQFYATVNPRNLMAFLTLRNDKHALKEIRLVAEQMEKIFAEQMPLTYRAYVEQREREQNPSVNMDGELLLKVQELEEELKFYKERNAILEERMSEAYIRDFSESKRLKLIQEKQEAERLSAAWKAEYEEKRDELYEALTQIKGLKEEVGMWQRRYEETEGMKPQYDINIVTKALENVDAAKIAARVFEQVKKYEDMRKGR
jgi:thymidylate synthase (FAD)